MKEVFDLKAKRRSFESGDQVLVLFPLLRSQLQAELAGPYMVSRKINDLNYVVDMPDRKKKQLVCHINMLKPYYSRVQ